MRSSKFVLTMCLVCSAGCAHVVPQRARKVSVGGRSTTVTQAELQQSLQRVTGVMSQRVAQAAEPLGGAEDARVTEQALRRALLYQASALDIASGPTPEVNLLDMLVFTTLTRDAFASYWVPEVFGADGQPMLDALVASERDVWRLADNVLDDDQENQVRDYIRRWQAEHPRQVQVEAVRLSEFAKQAGKSAEAQKTRGLISSVRLAAKAADEALLMGERALFLGQRVPFLLRSQVRLGALEVLGDSLGQLEQAEGLLHRSESLVTRVSELRSTLRDATDLTERTERVVAEAHALLDALSPLLDSFAPLMEADAGPGGAHVTRLELLADTARQTVGDSLRTVRTLQELAPAGTAEWNLAQKRLDASIGRWLTYLALVGVLWIVTACVGYVGVKRALLARPKRN